MCSCRSTASTGDGSGGAPPPPAPARVEFAALQAALAGGDDARAAELVEELGRAELEREERQQLEGARKVLRGRTLVAGLTLELASEEVAERPGLFELVLRGHNSNPGAVTLALPPADLRRHRATIDARGVEGLELDSKLCTVFADLAIPAGVASRWVILTYELPLGRALSVRERWRLVTRSGELVADGERFPAAAVAVGGCARERVSPLVEAPRESGASLAALLRADPPPTSRTLLERALAVPLDAREAALRALAPHVAELAARAPERVLAAEPALRWLSENHDIGADPAGWGRFLAQRQVVVSEEPAERPRLDLPERPRGR